MTGPSSPDHAPSSRPRSTPIPGVGDPFIGSPSLPGNAGAPPPPTATEFVAAFGSQIPSAAAQVGSAPPPSMFGAYDPGSSGVAAFDPAAFAAGYVPYRRKRSWGGRIFFVLMLLIGPGIAIGVGVWGFFAVREGIQQSEDLSDPNLSDRDRESLGLADDATTLFGGDDSAAVVGAFEEAIGGPATRFTRLLIYPDYAFAVAQDPDIPNHVDEYHWRSGEVQAPEPEPNADDLESRTFSSSEIDWPAVAVLVEQAPLLTGVESGAITHVIVERSTFAADGALQVSVYVSGPRDNGFIQATGTGELTAIY
jgi:hypothetical protein